MRLRRSKFAVKESQGLARVLDTLVFAYEFIMLPTPNLQAEGFEALRRTILRLHPDLKVCLAAARMSQTILPMLLPGRMDCYCQHPCLSLSHMHWTCTQRPRSQQCWGWMGGRVHMGTIMMRCLMKMIRRSGSGFMFCSCTWIERSWIEHMF